MRTGNSKRVGPAHLGQCRESLLECHVVKLFALLVYKIKKEEKRYVSLVFRLSEIGRYQTHSAISPRLAIRMELSALFSGAPDSDELARTAVAVDLRTATLVPRREVVEGSREMKDIRACLLIYNLSRWATKEREE